MSNGLVDEIIKIAQNQRDVVTVGEDGKFDSAQNALDSFGDEWFGSGSVYLLSTYDTSNDSYPLTLKRPVTLHGGGGTSLEPPGNKYAIEIDTDFPAGRPPGPRVSDVLIRGGGGGVRVQNGRYTVFDRVTVKGVGEDSFYIDSHTYDPEEDTGQDQDWAINTHHFYSCGSENPGRNGFRVGDGAHGAQFTNCHSYFAGQDGFHIKESYNSAMLGGSAEQCERNGIRCESSQSFKTFGIYVEGNCPGVGGGSEIIVTKNSANCDFMGGYGNGRHNNNRDGCERLIRFAGSRDCSISGFQFRNYEKSMYYVAEKASDADVNIQSHYPMDDTPFGPDEGFRTRSNGTIMPTDLSNMKGRGTFDKGIHIVDEGNPTECVWYDGDWWASGLPDKIV